MRNSKLYPQIEEYLWREDYVADEATYYDFPFDGNNLYVALRIPLSGSVDPAGMHFREIFLKFLAEAVGQLDVSAKSRAYTERKRQ